MPTYDLFVYHDMDDPIHDSPPAVGQDAGQWFGKGFESLYVTALAPGMHPHRITVVLGHGQRPEMQQEMKAYFTAR
jgi:hypothetical protein